MFVEQALNEAFEIFCNKTVAGISSAEILAIFCDSILKRGGSEKLSDEAIEEIHEKVDLMDCFLKTLHNFAFLSLIVVQLCR